MRAGRGVSSGDGDVHVGTEDQQGDAAECPRALLTGMTSNGNQRVMYTVPASQA